MLRSVLHVQMARLGPIRWIQHQSMNAITVSTNDTLTYHTGSSSCLFFSSPSSPFSFVHTFELIVRLFHPCSQLHSWRGEGRRWLVSLHNMRDCILPVRAAAPLGALPGVWRPDHYQGQGLRWACWLLTYVYMDTVVCLHFCEHNRPSVQAVGILVTILLCILLPAYCPSGQQWNAAEAACEPCPLGTHKDNLISHDVLLGQCMPCPENFTTPDAGLVYEANCSVGL